MRPTAEIYHFFRFLAKCNQVFCVGEVAEWSKAPHSKCGVREIGPWVRIPPSPPIYNFSVFEGCCLALATLGLGFRRYFEGKFEIQKQFLPAQTEVRTNLF